MTTSESDAAVGVARMAHIEALLASYPDVNEGELATLKNWFKREASALEVATLASKDELKSGYTQFRVDHIDKFTGKDIVFALVAALAVSGVVALVGYMA
jgi:dsRNA-specific ribonuclease